MGRLRHLAAFTASELAALWRERPAGGMEHAVSARLGHHIGIGAVRARLDGLAGATAELAGRAGSAEARTADLEHRAATGADELDRLAGRIDEVLGRIDDVAATLAA